MKKITPTPIYVSNVLNSIFMLTLVFSLTLSACKKDSGNEAPVNNSNNLPVVSPKTKFLTDKTWTLTASAIFPSIMGHTDLYSMMQPCEKDNHLKFNADNDKTMALDEGSVKCDAKDPQSVSGSWKFSNDEASLTMTLNSNSTDYNVITLDDKMLRVTYTMVYDGTTYTVTDLYSNQ